VASVTSQEARAWFLHGGYSRPNGAVSKRLSCRKPQDRKLPLTRLDQAKSSIDTDDDLSASSPESCSVCVSCISSRLESARRMMKRLSDPTFLLADRSSSLSDLTPWGGPDRIRARFDRFSRIFSR
jgi:hypothetical protein